MSVIILDRDGVINYESRDYIKNPSEWIPIPGSLEAIATLTQANHRVVIATNQSGLARGLFEVVDLEAIHRKMERLVSELGGHIETIVYCPHGPWDDCHCRKPRPGLLLAIAQSLGVSLAGVPCVGDSLRDIQAAQAVGANPVLVLTGNGPATFKKLKETKQLKNISVFADLHTFTVSFLQ